LRPMSVCAQSFSKISSSWLTMFSSVTMTPTSRRFSSSSRRRLWLPTNARSPSRMMARMCSRLLGCFSLRTFHYDSTRPMTRTSTPALIRSVISRSIASSLTCGS